MNPSKAWAMLTARGVQMGGTFGGIPELTPADIARMLKDLARGPFLAGMVKESGDMSCLGDLERYLWIDVMRIAEEERWPNSHGQAYCRRLAGLAVYEFVIPRPDVCSNCAGRGYIMVESNGVECAYCRNSGGQQVSANMRSDLAGIPYTSWRDGWAARYEEVHAAVHGWHSEALRHLRRALTASSAAA